MHPFFWLFYQKYDAVDMDVFIQK